MRSNGASPDPRVDAGPPSRAASRRAHKGLVLAGLVIIAAGFGVALVEAFRFPKGSIWVIIAVTAGLVGLIRAVTGRR